MTTFADLEIGLHRQEVGYTVELRFSQPGSDADIRPVQDARAQFDLELLRASASDPAAYGRSLTDSLFADARLKTAFAQALASAQSVNALLRLRVFIGSSAPELHNLRWEMLQDPASYATLSTNERIVFSRYLSSLDWQPVYLQAKGELRALVVVANPANLSSFAPGGQALAPVDVAAELERARSSFGDTLAAVTVLASGEPPFNTPTLNNIITHLRDGYDILYWVCHGALIKGEPRLWMEDESGNVAIVGGSELVTRLGELQSHVTLAVFASCQSAGQGNEVSSRDAGALAALGPRLAEAGIPAVVAMQGNITLHTVTAFMPAFFKELERDGLVDRAMAAARGAVRGASDCYLPVLFMRLRSGRIWYVPGFGDERPGFEKWPTLTDRMNQGRCTPILGPGLIEFLVGSTRALAQRWADTYHYPMSPYDREDLPQVAQYLAVNQDEGFLREQLGAHIRQELLSRFGSLANANHASLEQLVQVVGAQRWQSNPSEPHLVLAHLPLPIYITTNPDTLLEQALNAVGKKPQTELCLWNDALESRPSIYDQEPNYRPDVQHPMVYHLFGLLREPDTLVLTEDDYFDFLIGVTRNKDLIPEVVRRALADTALLFLGFRMEDWNFRVLFRSIMSQEGRGRRKKYSHVAAQIDPEGGRILEPERARHYLESYFEDADISIFWGSVQDFSSELERQWKAKFKQNLLGSSQSEGNTSHESAEEMLRRMGLVPREPEHD